MKKIVLVCLTVLMIFSLSLTAFAADSFVSSPFKKGAPELVSAANESPDCTAKVFITSYADRASLPPETVEKLEYAYNAFCGKVEDRDLTALLAQIAEKYGIHVNDLSVSDFFDISATDCQNHEYHGQFDILLKAEALENFVCLVHYYNGGWRVVDGAEVTQGGTHLVFTEEEFSPFAIIVNTGDTPLKDPTDDPSKDPINGGISGQCCHCTFYKCHCFFWWILTLIVIIILHVIVYVIYRLIKRKKNKKNDEEKDN